MSAGRNIHKSHLKNSRSQLRHGAVRLEGAQCVKKSSIVNDYQRSLEVFAHALAHGETKSSPASRVATELSSRLANAKAAILLNRY